MIADRHGAVSVLFGDIVGFTETSARLTPAQLIEEMNELFSGFDAICFRTGIEKIKTIGDACLAVGGLEAPRRTTPPRSPRPQSRWSSR